MSAVTNDHHALHAQERCAAVLGIVEELEELLRLRPPQHVGERLLHHAHEHPARGLVELEDDVADEAIAHNDVDPSLLALARQNVAAFDAPDVRDPRRLLEELVCFLDYRVALLVLLTDVEQAHARLRPVQHVAHIDRAELGEADELAGVAVHIGSAVDDQDGMDRGRKQWADRRPLHTLMQPQQQRRGRHHRAGVARRKDRKSTRLNSSHTVISYAVFCLKKKKNKIKQKKTHHQYK